MNKNPIINKKTKIYLIFLFIIILLLIKIYYTHYFIDITNFEEIITNNEYISPNKKYILKIKLIKLRDRENENEYYILGELEKNQMEVQNTKIIYWNKAQGNFYEDIIYCKWINNQKIKIQNKELNIIFCKRYYFLNS